VSDPPKTGPQRPDQRIRASRLKTDKAQVKYRILFSSGTGFPPPRVIPDGFRLPLLPAEAALGGADRADLDAPAAGQGSPTGLPERGQAGAQVPGRQPVGEVLVGGGRRGNPGTAVRAASSGLTASSSRRSACSPGRSGRPWRGVTAGRICSGQSAGFAWSHAATGRRVPGRDRPDACADRRDAWLAVPAARRISTSPPNARGPGWGGRRSRSRRGAGQLRGPRAIRSIRCCVLFATPSRCSRAQPNPVAAQVMALPGDDQQIRTPKVPSRTWPSNRQRKLKGNP
jgi:hypothetical protein